MKSLFWANLISLLIVFFSLTAQAGDFLSKADVLYNRGGMENYKH